MELLLIVFSCTTISRFDPKVDSRDWHTAHHLRPTGQDSEGVLLPVDQNESRYAKISYFSKIEPSYIHKNRTLIPHAETHAALVADDRRQKQRAKKKAFIAGCQ